MNSPHQPNALRYALGLRLLLLLWVGGNAMAQPWASRPMTAERYNDRWTLWGIPLAGEFVDSRTIARHHIRTLRCTTQLFDVTPYGGNFYGEAWWPPTDESDIWRTIEARFDTAGRIIEKTVLQNYRGPGWDTTHHRFSYYFENDARLVRHEEIVASSSGVNVEVVDYEYGNRGELRRIERRWAGRWQGRMEFEYDAGRLISIVDDYYAPYVEHTLTTRLDSTQRTLSTEHLHSWGRFLFWHQNRGRTISNYNYDAENRLISVFNYGDPLPIWDVPFVEIACYSNGTDERRIMVESFTKSEAGQEIPSCAALERAQRYENVNTTAIELDERGLPVRVHHRGRSVHDSNGSPVSSFLPMIDHFEYEVYRDLH